MRHAACTAGIVLVSVAALPPARGRGRPGHAALQVGRFRYPFEPGGPKTFGVFKLRITDGGCAAAHRVARAWMAEFELNILLGEVKLPRKVAGFTFTTLPPNAAQTYRERGRKGTTTIRFDYRVPNG